MSTGVLLVAGASSSTSTSPHGEKKQGPAGKVDGATATEDAYEGTSITTTSGATTTTRGDDDSNVPVVLEPVVASMAKEVALFCRGGIHPGAPCCEPVVGYVDLAGICGAESQPLLIMARLNASRLLTLYNDCGGQRVLATAACQGTSKHTAPIALSPSSTPRFKLSTSASAPALPGIDQAPPATFGLLLPLSGKVTCDTGGLASDLVTNCNMSRSRQLQTPACCQAIVRTVDQRCLCSVEEDSTFDYSHLSVEFVWRNYRACGGRRTRVPTDESSCLSPASPPRPPVSPPQPSPPASRHRHLSRQAVAGLIAAAAVTAILLIAAAVGVFLWWKKRAAERRNADGNAIEPGRQQGEGVQRMDEDANNRMRVQAFLNRRLELN